MTAIVFDTLAYAEKLEAAGFTAEQAKGWPHALREIIDNQREKATVNIRRVAPATATIHAW